MKLPKINGIAHIPYITHEYRMFKAIERETAKYKKHNKILLIALTVTNVFWLAVVGLVVFFSGVAI